MHNTTTSNLQKDAAHPQLLMNSGNNDKPPSNKQTVLLQTVTSYQNHVLSSAFYLGSCCYCWSQLYSDSTIGAINSIPLGAALGFLCMAFLLQREINQMILRKHMPPGDSGWPIIGHLFSLIHNTEACHVSRIQKYGPISTMWNMGYQVLLLTNDEDVQWANSQERKGKTSALTLPHLEKLLGEESIMLKSGAGHKKLRKIFEPAFTPSAIRDYAGSIDEIATEQLEKWCHSGEWQSSRQWALLAMRVFFKCAFGEANEERMERLTILFEGWTAGFNTVIPFAIPGTPLYKAYQYRNELDKEIQSMINEFKTKNPPGSEAAQKSVMGRLCYGVDEDGNSPSEKELLDNLRFFLVAGFDTIKGSFGAITRFVTENPKVEQALVDEVQQLKETISIDQIKNEAPILNAVLAESWRLDAPLSSHSCVADEDLHYKNYVVPKGTFICADIHAHNKLNDKLYPDPSKFHFERWLPKGHPLYDVKLANGESIDYNVMSSKFRAFGMGTHTCLGGHFAKLEARIVIARLFQKYKIELTNHQIKRFPIKQRLSDFRLTRQTG